MLNLTRILSSNLLVKKHVCFYHQRLSNPKELIDDTCYMAAHLATVWESWDYYDKQSFQNVLFSEGLHYGIKIEHYRTPKVNSVFGYIACLSRDLDKRKSRFPHNLSEKNGSVPGKGLEPLRLT